jgi:hypothetical protein
MRTHRRRKVSLTANTILSVAGDSRNVWETDYWLVGVKSIVITLPAALS